jgi:hypothetical protein
MNRAQAACDNGAKSVSITIRDAHGSGVLRRDC